MHSEESGLALRLQHRDPLAVAELYDRYGRLAFAVIHRQVNDFSVVEDLVQETFLRVWTGIGSFDAERGALGPWVLAVARNRAIDYLRSVDRRLAQASVELDAARPLRSTGNSVEGDILHRERLCAVQRSLRYLRPNHRVVLELAFGEGLSHVQIAERLRQPLGTVKTWVRTALKMLRTQVA